jgi:hypothetical protein
MPQPWVFRLTSVKIGHPIPYRFREIQLVYSMSRVPHVHATNCQYSSPVYGPPAAPPTPSHPSFAYSGHPLERKASRLGILHSSGSAEKLKRLAVRRTRPKLSEPRTGKWSWSRDV